MDGWGTESRVFRLAELTAKTAANGSESWDVARAAVVTGERVGIHESEQPKGATPNPAHKIEHSELICVREGALEFVHDGKTERVEAGGVIYVAKGTMHQLRNVGDGVVEYFVVAVGGDQ